METNLIEIGSKTPKNMFSVCGVNQLSFTEGTAQEYNLYLKERSRDDDECADTKNSSHMSLMRPVRGNIQTNRHADMRTVNFIC